MTHLKAPIVQQEKIPYSSARNTKFITEMQRKERLQKNIGKHKE
jgi:hypothetical protein